MAPCAVDATGVTVTKLLELVERLVGKCDHLSACVQRRGWWKDSPQIFGIDPCVGVGLGYEDILRDGLVKLYVEQAIAFAMGARAW